MVVLGVEEVVVVVVEVVVVVVVLMVVKIAIVLFEEVGGKKLCSCSSRLGLEVEEAIVIF